MKNNKNRLFKGLVLHCGSNPDEKSGMSNLEYVI